MSVFELLVIAVGLSMDAFSVSVCKGISVKKVELKHALICGGWFGAFQGIMPVTGYLLGVRFVEYVQSIDHWIAFGLLLYIGLNMIKESKEQEKADDDFSAKTMLIMAIATSIDALTIGVSFAFLQVDILFSASAIAITTFLFSFVGVYLGNKVGGRLGNHAEVVGGVVLICLGIKILVEHLFF